MEVYFEALFFALETHMFFHVLWESVLTKRDFRIKKGNETQCDQDPFQNAAKWLPTQRRELEVEALKNFEFKNQPSCWCIKYTGSRDYWTYTLLLAHTTSPPKSTGTKNQSAAFQNDSTFVMFEFFVSVCTRFTRIQKRELVAFCFSRSVYENSFFRFVPRDPACLSRWFFLEKNSFTHNRDKP